MCPNTGVTYVVGMDPARATQFGGKVCCPGIDISNVERFAVATDPIGATFALYKNT